ncbi:DUF6223 family protein [Streptomyces sp. NPDC058955]|uniref:DUF6223 family protein n=1 Tax=unclassified Streptomyces TaxID=2593676 RepID=UPI00364DF771
MSVRRLLATGTAALLGGLALAAPASAASDPVSSLAASATTVGAGRLGSFVGAVIGLIGLAVAWRAVARPTGRLGVATGPLGPLLALAAGVVAVVLGGLVAATADGGLGTGNGLGGAYVSLLVGLAATALGGRAVARSRRHAG